MHRRGLNIIQRMVNETTQLISLAPTSDISTSTSIQKQNKEVCDISIDIITATSTTLRAKEIEQKKIVSASPRKPLRKSYPLL